MNYYSWKAHNKQVINKHVYWFVPVCVITFFGVLITISYCVSTLPTRVPIPQTNMCKVRQIILKNQTVYAYTSLPKLTDQTPTWTASNTKTRVGIIANNYWGFGTYIKIDQTIYRVEDRMNSRYDKGVWDIWLPSYTQAKKFGKQTKDVIIYY